MRVSPKVHLSAAGFVASLTVLTVAALALYLRAYPLARPRARRWGWALLGAALLCLAGGLCFVYLEGDSLLLGLLTIASFYACPFFLCTGAYLVSAGSQPA